MGFEIEAKRICEAAGINNPTENLLKYIELTLQQAYRMGRIDGMETFHDNVLGEINKINATKKGE